MKLEKKLHYKYRHITFLFTILTIFFRADNINAEISVDSYCQLTIQAIQQQIPQVQELIALVNQFKDDPVTLDQQLETKRAEFDQSREFLYNSYGTTAQEFVTYMNRNKKAVDEYLSVNSDINQQINDLSSELNVLLEEEDELRQSLESTDEQPLPVE